MTEKEAKNLRQGALVYIYGNKTKAQRINWAGYDTFHIKGDYVRFTSGLFFNIKEDYELIELAPFGTEYEKPSRETIKIRVMKFGSPSCVYLDAPVETIRGYHQLFLHLNKITMSEFGYYESSNEDIFNNIIKNVNYDSGSGY